MEPVPALTNDPNGFDGEFVIDWSSVAWPFDEITPLHMVEVAAGRLWVLANTTPQITDVFVTRTGRDRLLVSDNGQEWAEIDLDALGIAADISGGSVITGDDDRVVVAFSDTNGVSGPDSEQPLPWVLVGDIDDWQVFGPDDFGPWSLVNAADARLSVGSMLDVAIVGDTVVAAIEAGWRGTGSPAVGSIVTLTLDLSTGETTVLADRSAPFADSGFHTIKSLVAFDGAVYGFGESTSDTGIALTVWRTADGLTWSEQRPGLAELPAFVDVVDAVAGPPGVMVIAEVDADNIGMDGGVALFSPDGVEWTIFDLGENWIPHHVYWANDRFVVSGIAHPNHPVDGFETTWFSTDGVEWTSVDRRTDLFMALDVVAIPGALVAVTNRRLYVSGALPPYATLGRVAHN